ncbi:cyclic nucleotide-binding domain-containing protein [Candidatus Woesearchaeota archaeon]|nr:cyclic nucleotide-binding domain-containing protein [Candidatus Woesearchaeota archaeon]
MKELFAYIFENNDEQALKTELGKSLLFQGLSPKELSIVAKKVNLRRYNKGEHVFFQGDPGSALYVILDGEVNIERIESNKKIHLAGLTRGMFFGELALVYDASRSATAYVSENATLFCLFKHDLDNLLTHHPRLANKVILNLARILADRLKATNDRLSRK